jgi:hypothetical protein
MAFAAVASASAFAGDPAVVQQLRDDLVGKTVTLATDVAGYACVYSSSLSVPTRRLVDTEVTPDNGTRYFLRADRFMNVTQCSPPKGRISGMGGDYIDTRMVSRMYPTGSTAVVKLIEAKSDRVEIQLAPAEASSGDDGYSKIKLMLGKGYESRSLEEVETMLARGIRMPRIESVVQLRASLQNINAAIADHERQLADEQNPTMRVSIAKTLLAEYQSKAEAEERYNAVAFDKVAVDHSPPRETELNTIITQGMQQIQAEKIQAASGKYSNALFAMKTSCSRISKAPASSLTELDSMSATTQAAQGDLNRFVEARQEMVALRQVIPSADDQFYLSCGADAVSAAERLAKQRPELIQQEAKAAEQKRREQAAAEIAALRAEFARMKEQRAGYDAKLVSAIGGPEASSIFAEYRVHLQHMLVNRQKGLELGDEGARLEIISLQDDIKKLH